MIDTITTKGLTRFGLTPDFATCLVEFETESGTGRLSFPAEQLGGVIQLLLQVKQLHSEKTEGEGTRSVLVAERVGVLVQPEATVMDFVIGGAPMSFAVPTEMARQLLQILKDRLAPSA